MRAQPARRARCRAQRSRLDAQRAVRARARAATTRAPRRTYSGVPRLVRNSEHVRRGRELAGVPEREPRREGSRVRREEHAARRRAETRECGAQPCTLISGCSAVARGCHAGDDVARSCGAVRPRTRRPSSATEICAVSSLTTITSASRLLGQPERGAVPRAECAINVLRLRQRQDAPCPHDRVAADDHGAIVQRRVRREDGREQIGAHLAPASPCRSARSRRARSPARGR